jgi:sulfotransferase 6B1
MSNQTFLKSTKDKLRRARNSVRSAYRWKRLNFSTIPSVFGNAMPKSGSHLLLQILQGLMQIAPFRHLEQAPVRMITADGRKRDMKEIMHDLSRLNAGMIEWGYLSADPEFIDFFNDHPQVAPLFIYRDPRDQLISSIFYAVDIHLDHALHDYYSSISFDERIRTAIQGRDAPGLEYLPNIRAQYDRNLAWLDFPGMLCLRFEDLVTQPQPQIERVLDFLIEKNLPIAVEREDAINVVLEAIQPKNSPTFRKGSVGGWREHFSEEHIQLFKDVSGDLLVRLGYEEDDAW